MVKADFGDVFVFAYLAGRGTVLGMRGTERSGMTPPTWQDRTPVAERRIQSVEAAGLSALLTATAAACGRDPGKREKAVSVNERESPDFSARVTTCLVQASQRTGLYFLLAVTSLTLFLSPAYGPFFLMVQGPLTCRWRPSLDLKHLEGR